MLCSYLITSHLVPIKLRYSLYSDESLCRLLLELHVLCEQALCHNCFQLEIVLKFVTSKIMLQPWR